MKITKSRLKQIIKEELANTLNEATDSDGYEIEPMQRDVEEVGEMQRAAAERKIIKRAESEGDNFHKAVQVMQNSSTDRTYIERRHALNLYINEFVEAFNRRGGV